MSALVINQIESVALSMGLKVTVADYGRRIYIAGRSFTNPQHALDYLSSKYLAR
jgi:hypothetical protein